MKYIGMQKNLRLSFCFSDTRFHYNDNNWKTQAITEISGTDSLNR